MNDVVAHLLAGVDDGSIGGSLDAHLREIERRAAAAPESAFTGGGKMGGAIIRTAIPAILRHGDLTVKRYAWLAFLSIDTAMQRWAMDPDQGRCSAHRLKPWLERLTREWQMHLDGGELASDNDCPTLHGFVARITAEYFAM